jgi:hypothetical protein
LKQFNGDNIEQVYEMLDNLIIDIDEDELRHFINTLEGKMELSWGDYVIRGVKGEFYPCNPDIFELTYEIRKNKMAKFKSTKLFDGYSTCFRQWRAEDTHCKYLHGYAVSFRVWFEGDLDHRNWVWDFGGMKRSKTKILGMSPKDYFAWLLDHTTIVAS